jgi:hypothetical protein
MTTKFDPTKPVQRRNGQKAEIACTLKSGRHVAVIDDEHVVVFQSDGGYSQMGGTAFCPYDLINIPETFERKGWVNVYPEHTGQIFDNKDRADDRRDRGAIACVQVTIRGTVGEGL